MPFINNPNSLSDLITFIISSISSFVIINTVVPDPHFFLISAYVADIPAYNPNCFKTLLARGVSSLFINCKPVVIHDLIRFKDRPS